MTEDPVPPKKKDAVGRLSADTRSVVAGAARTTEQVAHEVAPAARAVGHEVKEAGAKGLDSLQRAGERASSSSDPIAAGAGKATVLAAKGTREVGKAAISITRGAVGFGKRGLKKAEEADQPKSS